MSSIVILWLDDDSPEKLSKPHPEVSVLTAQCCEDAERILTSASVKPRWAIVDLIVTQGGWEPPYQKFPGLAYIRHLSTTHGMSVLAFSYFLNDKLRVKALEAGALETYSKGISGLDSVFDDIIRRTGSKGPEEGV